ncbi:hypothetical protein BAUCODRAFT_61447 [Baudoinia panamericana UAMH 10762]|uniref:Manganese lipoxygenase n=1 Tax=Baudoinia panamericana (strain UAMH 10762) TaxID=717646 RepID=M2NA54_BAUPA|nr:uncharacterized protein BAUCODRAFT_61447 [Baudoinia panamericana UAMH 10762]EMD01099.1 hypothetical protein BAUCODRAFT_61447 [Baudoinia panamericana UAMH 10762]
MCLVLTLTLGCDGAAVLPRQSIASTAGTGAQSIVSLWKSVSNPLPSSSGTVPDLTVTGNYYTTPKSPNPLLRSTGILAKRLTFLYGTPLAGGPYFPTGVLGFEKVAADVAYIEATEFPPVLAGTLLDDTQATADYSKYNDLETVADYTKLYSNECRNQLPSGPAPGAETNYTEDLFFSMERLSNSPYQVRRLNPTSDTLAFTIADNIAQNLTGRTLNQLFQAGRLFYADYRDQGELTRTDRYAAACDAYFYIDPSSAKFLPLAIRSNYGANLIYTPADDAADWILAKIVFNVNDFWFAQWNHLAATHEVVQIAYMAAIRTLSEEHPVQAMLNRLMFEVFAVQPLAQTVLFDPGAAVDLTFAYTGQAAQDYSTDYYQNKGSGRFVDNYFQTDLQRRGLINCTYGPALSHFPFYEDGTVIWNAINTFMTSFVQSYYSSDSAVDADSELQAWAKEANGPAEAIDFPTSISSRSTLIATLTHFAHLVSISHHTVNTNELLSLSSTLPFHPTALYAPLPTIKGNTSVVDFLPPFDKVLEQLTLTALFARPQFVGTNRTLMHMFDDQAMLGKMNAQTRSAASAFMSSMQAFSSQVSGRTFGSDGLSQGMPFIWQALDPNVAPFSLTT